MLPIRYKVDPNLRGLTALGGLPLYLELAHVAGLVEAIRNNLCVRAQGDGWSDVQVVMALILLNLAGGSAVDDIQHLGEDEGFVEILRGRDESRPYGICAVTRGESSRERLGRAWRNKSGFAAIFAPFRRVLMYP